MDRSEFTGYGDYSRLLIACGMNYGWLTKPQQHHDIFFLEILVPRQRNPLDAKSIVPIHQRRAAGAETKKWLVALNSRWDRNAKF